MKSDITFVISGGGWEAIYVNGKLFDEGHSVNFMSLLHFLEGSVVGASDVKEADNSWLESRGSFPISLEDVEFLTYD